MATLDIQRGTDILVMDGAEYPIEDVQIWPGPAISGSFGLLATATAHTKRKPAVAGNKRGEAVAHLADFACTPRLPINASVLAQMPFEAPYQLRQVFVDGGDNWLVLTVREGDR